MARKAGLPVAAATSLTERRATRAERELIELAVAGTDAAGTTVALNDIADHPENTRDDLGDVSDIKASLPTLGLLQLPVVLSRAAFLRVHPDYADRIGSCRYVALIGHRRLKACRELGWTQVEVRVGDHLVDDQGADIETMVVENVQRRNLNPIEEARAIAALQAKRKDQYEVAQRLGYSQSYISKRLKLLKLAPELQDAVVNGWQDATGGNTVRLAVSEAIVYADLPDQDQQSAAWKLAQERGLKAAAAKAEVLESTERDRRVAQARTRAEKENLDLVDADALWGASAPAHRLHGDDEVAQARSAGTLRAATDARGEFIYVTTSVPTTAAGTIPRQGDDSERRAATQARAAACRRIAGRKPAAAEATRRLALCITDRATAYVEALRLAHSWLQASNVGPDTSDPPAYRDAIIAGGDDQLLVHLATTMALAYDELHARAPHHDWDHRDVAHLQRLRAEASYQPTAWELDRIARAQASEIPTESTPDPDADLAPVH